MRMSVRAPSHRAISHPPNVPIEKVIGNASYEINKHGKIVFPANCFPDLDFSTFESLEQLDPFVRRDFDSKAPTGSDILERIKTGAYQSKFELMRDMALNLFWANRFKLTMYDVRPTRGPTCRVAATTPTSPSIAVGRSRNEGDRGASAYPGLAAQWDAEVEDSILEILFDVFGHRKNQRPSRRPCYPQLPICCLTPLIKLCG